jgi:hypothetical protein
MRPTIAQNARHTKKAIAGMSPNIMSFWKKTGTPSSVPFLPIKKQSNENTCSLALLTVFYDS